MDLCLFFGLYFTKEFPRTQLKTKHYNHKTTNPQRFVLASTVIVVKEIKYALPNDTNIHYFPINDHQSLYSITKLYITLKYCTLICHNYTTQKYWVSLCHVESKRNMLLKNICLYLFTLSINSKYIILYNNITCCIICILCIF